MDKEEIKEYGDLKSDNNIELIIYFSIFSMGILNFISAMMRDGTHDYFFYFFGMVGLIMFIFELKIKKKRKKRLKELEKRMEDGGQIK